MEEFSHIIDDADPVFQYYPYADGDASGGWAPYFTGSGGFRNINDEPGDDGVGQSLHYTAFSGSSVALEFHGTAISLFGSANCTYDVTIDGSAVGPGQRSAETLFTTTGLSSDTHLLNLTVHASNESQFALDNAIITDGFGPLVPAVFDNTDSTLIYSGAWDIYSNAQIPNKTAPKPYHQTSASMASVSLTFTGSAVAINGASNWGHWTYVVTLDGVSRQYNASTYWLVGNTQLFWESGLDPTQPHQIELINSAATGMVMSLNDFTVYMPTDQLYNPGINTPFTGDSGGGSSSDVDIGVIVGPVVAGGVLIVLIAAVLMYKRRRKTRISNSPVAVEEPLVTPTPTPYHEGHSQTLLNAKTGQATLSFTASPLPEQPYQNERPVATDNLASSNRYVHPSTAQHTQSLPPLSPAQQPVDVDRIIELIAQRIDRAPPHASGDDAPPRYPPT